MDKFIKIFQLLSPWGRGEHSILLAERLFHVMDEAGKGKATFYSFVLTLGVLLHGDLKDRLSLLYRLHTSSVEVIPVMNVDTAKKVIHVILLFHYGMCAFVHIV